MRFRHVAALAVMVAGVAITQAMTALVVDWARVAWFLVSGQADEWTGGLAIGILISAPVVSVLLLMPFAPVAAAIVEETVSWIAIVIAFGVSVVGSVTLLRADTWTWARLVATPVAVGAVLLADYGWTSIRVRPDATV